MEPKLVKPDGIRYRSTMKTVLVVRVSANDVWEALNRIKGIMRYKHISGNQMDVAIWHWVKCLVANLGYKSGVALKPLVLHRVGSEDSMWPLVGYIVRCEPGFEDTVHATILGLKNVVSVTSIGDGSDELVVRNWIKPIVMDILTNYAWEDAFDPKTDADYATEKHE